MHDAIPTTQEVSEFLAGRRERIDAVRRSVDAALRAMRIRDADERAGLIQETLLRVLLSLRSGRFRGDASLATYAQRIARHVWLENLRRRREQVPLDPDLLPATDRWSSPEGSLLQAEAHRASLKRFHALPAPCKELLLAIFVEGLSYREVAVRLGISVMAVRLRVFRCRLAGRGAEGVAAPAKQDAAPEHRVEGDVKGAD